MLIKKNLPWGVWGCGDGEGRRKDERKNERKKRGDRKTKNNSVYLLSPCKEVGSP